jgi:hypothetical protein
MLAAILLSVVLMFFTRLAVQRTIRAPGLDVPGRLRRLLKLARRRDTPGDIPIGRTRPSFRGCGLPHRRTGVPWYFASLWLRSAGRVPADGYHGSSSPDGAEMVTLA